MQLLNTFVKKRGYGDDLCQLAEDGSQAVDAFEAFAPDVVFMDISMVRNRTVKGIQDIPMCLSYCSQSLSTPRLPKT